MKKMILILSACLFCLVSCSSPTGGGSSDNSNTTSTTTTTPTNPTNTPSDTPTTPSNPTDPTSPTDTPTETPSNPTNPTNPSNPTDTPSDTPTNPSNPSNPQVRICDVTVYVARPNINGSCSFTISGTSTVGDVIHKLQFENNVVRTYRTDSNGNRLYMIYPMFYYWSTNGEHINKTDIVQDLIDNHEGSNNKLKLYTVWTQCVNGTEYGDLEH